MTYQIKVEKESRKEEEKNIFLKTDNFIKNLKCQVRDCVSKINSVITNFKLVLCTYSRGRMYRSYYYIPFVFFYEPNINCYPDWFIVKSMVLLNTSFNHLNLTNVISPYRYTYI